MAILFFLFSFCMVYKNNFYVFFIFVLFQGCHPAVSEKKDTHTKRRSWILDSENESRETLAPRVSKAECHGKRQAAFQNGCITQEELEDLEYVNGKPNCDGNQLEAWVPCADE